jgi:Domain of unknown function (DUF4148)
MTFNKTLSAGLIALATLSATSTFAQSQGPVDRAQVRAELAQARAQGVVSTTTNERANPDIVQGGTPKARTDVKAELAQALASGEFDNPSERLTFVFDDTKSSKSRAAVKADVLQAKSNGSMANPGTARVPYGTTGRS